MNFCELANGFILKNSISAGSTFSEAFKFNFKKWNLSDLPKDKTNIKIIIENRKDKNNLIIKVLMKNLLSTNWVCVHMVY